MVWSNWYLQSCSNNLKKLTKMSVWSLLLQKKLASQVRYPLLVLVNVMSLILTVKHNQITKVCSLPYSAFKSGFWHSRLRLKIVVATEVFMFFSCSVVLIIVLSKRTSSQQLKALKKLIMTFKQTECFLTSLFGFIDKVSLATFTQEEFKSVLFFLHCSAVLTKWES